MIESDSDRSIDFNQAGQAGSSRTRSNLRIVDLGSYYDRIRRRKQGAQESSTIVRKAYNINNEFGNGQINRESLMLFVFKIFLTLLQIQLVVQYFNL